MFTIEEITLMRIYMPSSSPKREQKQSLIKKLENVLPFFSDEEEEMKIMTEAVIGKLLSISETEWQGVDFTQALWP